MSPATAEIPMTDLAWTDTNMTFDARVGEQVLSAS